MFKYFINAEDKNVGTRIFMAGPDGVLCTNDNGILKSATSEEAYNAFMSGTMAVAISMVDGTMDITRAITLQMTDSGNSDLPVVTKVKADTLILAVKPIIEPSNPLDLNDGNIQI